MNMAITTDDQVIMNEGFRLPAVGYRFNPTNQELIVHFLYNKCEENTLYFFTRLKNKNDEKGKRINRATDSSTWRAQRDRKIFSYSDYQRVFIGFRRSFSFMLKTGSQESCGKWVMHEYRLHGCNLVDQSNAMKDYVLCRIIKKKSSKGGRSKSNNNDQSVGS
ncbi:hypothetical protein EZV62_025127 [Acer yangbiense]|uniref:NAC domain-containing protein n=1 Tax=Acer yangbiense TaxID=1000413 RepID=A0A5C7GY57_9ROSI|nr:hypothetical protein EZV62_025127 [Acer yangbiense]